MDTQGHTPLQIAQARSHTYDLLSRLYQHGLTAEEMPFVRAIPELVATLPPSESYDAEEMDEMAADHYDILQTNVFPYQSIFLDTEGLVGGSVAESVLAFYGQVGFAVPDADSPAPDYVGLQLTCLGWLSAAEADARQDEQTAQVSRMRHLQRRLLDEHLLRWLFPLTQAIRQQGHAFYTALADLTLAMVVAHRGELTDDLPVGQTEFTLTSAPDLLDNQKTGLKEIAGYLLLPAYSGIFLSRKDIEHLARRHNLPRGFGSRLQMLTNLLRAAANYDALSALLDDLSTLLEGWRSFYSDYLEAVQPIAAINAVWLQRIEMTQEVIGRVQQAALAEQAQPEEESTS